jgi:hypothetical protein
MRSYLVPPHAEIERYTNHPFPHRKFIPGQGIHPDKDPHGPHIPKIPAGSIAFGTDSWSRSPQYLYAIDLFNFGYWWEAHEVLEKIWIQTGRSTPVARFIQGLIQISAALLKYPQSNPRVASRLVAGGLGKLKLQSGVYLGIKIDDFAHQVERYFAGGSSSLPRIILWTSDDTPLLRSQP